MTAHDDHPTRSGRVKYRGKGRFWSKPRSVAAQVLFLVVLVSLVALMVVSDLRWVRDEKRLSVVLSARYGEVVHVYRHPGSRSGPRYQHIYVNGALRPDCRIPDDAHPRLVCTKPIFLLPPR